jgi:hypothetical protein
MIRNPHFMVQAGGYGEDHGARRKVPKRKSQVEGDNGAWAGESNERSRVESNEERGHRVYRE